MRLLTAGKLLGWVGVVLTLAAIPLSLSTAKTLHVPSEYAFIFEAVDSASFGDTVLVAPGTYCRERNKILDTNRWIVMKDGVTLISEGGPEVTTLVETSHETLNTVVHCESVLDARVSGFTITTGECLANGSLQALNTAVYLQSSDVIVEDNIIYYCWYAVDVYGESPRARSPVIRDNEIRDCMTGVQVEDVLRPYSPLIQGNSIRNCIWGIWSRDSNAHIVGNVITGHTEDGIYFDGYSESLMQANTIVGNGKHGVYAEMDYIYQSPCLNCTFELEMANNVYGNGWYDVYYIESTGLGLFMAIYNYWGTLCPDPSRFYGRIDVSVWTDSTHTVICTDCENCYHSTEPTTWGKIKAMFR